MNNKTLLFATCLALATPPFAPTASAEEKPNITPPPAAADSSGATTSSKEQPVDLLQKSIVDYQNGNLKEALKATEQAQNAIRTKHADSYRAVLPPAPGGGWEIDEAIGGNTTLGSELMGGMTTTSRSYKANGHHVAIAFLADSPMLALASAMAQVITSSNTANGNSTEEIKGYKAIYLDRVPIANKPPLHQLKVFAGDVVVLVSSETVPKETLLQFANFVDYDKLKTVK